MLDNIRKYVNAFDNGGPILAAIMIIDDELGCDFVKKTSKIVGGGEHHALAAVLESILDIDMDIFRSILTGSVLVDNLFPVPNLSFTSSVHSSFTSSASATNKEDMGKQFDVEEIVDLIVEDDVTKYGVKWADSGDVTYEPLMTLWSSDDQQYTCIGKIQEFHQKNPHILPMHNVGDVSQGLMGVTEKEDHPIYSRELGIYAHFFVGVTPDNNLWRSPSTQVISDLLDAMEEYCRDYPQNHPRYATHEAFVDSVDNPDPKFNISNTTYNTPKRHLDIPGRINDVNKFIAVKRAECAEISRRRWDQPFPFPLTEVGLTANMANRRAAHATRSSTTALFAFWESLALYKYDGKYRWVFQPLCLVRDGSHFAVLESFFSRALQSYVHLGGVNIHPAGISQDARKFDMIDRSGALDKVDFETLDENLKWAVNRLKCMDYVVSKSARPVFESQLQKVTKELESKRAKYYVGFYKELARIQEVMRNHLKILARTKELEELASKLERMKVLKTEMLRMQASGEASER